MKKTLLSFLFLFGFLFGYAQNWQCLQSGVKHYFINDSGYLRGIRIDSVRSYADSIVYYPYHTPRGRYNYSSALNFTLDGNSGSWLGKRVLQLRDGTFLFDNIWHDTVIIKTQASLGESWIFYNDTTTHYYQAKMVSFDTSTILGVLDSIKSIKINAYDTTGIDTSDPVNNFKIVLSKNHGFVQVFDLYTFPYHAPDSLYSVGADYFLDLVVNNYDYGYGLYGAHPDTFNSLFNLLPLINPTFPQLYDWNIGDVFENRVCDISHPGDCIYPYQYYFDSITNKTVVAGGVAYDFAGWIATQHYPPFYYVADYDYPYDTVATNYTLFYPGDLLIDTILMPEELNQQHILYYHPNDTTLCLEGAKYQINESNMDSSIWQDIFFESSGIQETYKIGLGLPHYYLYTIGNPSYETEDTTLIYYRKSGISCGVFVIPEIAASVKNISLSNNYIDVFPNPASTEITIKTNTTQPYTVTLINTLGQTLKTIQTTKQQETISTSGLPAGVYDVSITDGNGMRYNEKVVIVH